MLTVVHAQGFQSFTTQAVLLSPALRGGGTLKQSDEHMAATQLAFVRLLDTFAFLSAPAAAALALPCFHSIMAVTPKNAHAAAPTACPKRTHSGHSYTDAPLLQKPL